MSEGKRVRKECNYQFRVRRIFFVPHDLENLVLPPINLHTDLVKLEVGTCPHQKLIEIPNYSLFV